MDVATSVSALSNKLADHDTHQHTLLSLLQLSSRGIDVAHAAERVVRNCLFSESGTTPQILSLALDVLIASPSHVFWVDAISVILENLRRSSTRACLTVLLKIPSLPHAAQQHLLLYCTTSTVACISNDPSPSIRRAAVHAVASLVLRSRPLTAPSTDAVRLQPVDSLEHTRTLRRAIERLMLSLLEAVFDPADQVAVAALTHLTSYVYTASTLNTNVPLAATQHATARAVCHILVSSLARITKRFGPVFSTKNADARHLKETISSFARLTCHVLSITISDASPPQVNAPPASTAALHEVNSPVSVTSTVAEDIADAHRRAVAWVDSVLLPLSDHKDIELSSAACQALFMVCSYSGDSPSPEKVFSWGMRAIRNVIRLISHDDRPIPSIVASALVRDAAFSLAALSKSESATSKFISSSAISLLPYAATCPGQRRRLQVVSVLAATVVEFDLSGRDSVVATVLKALLKSESWRLVLAESKTDSTVACEVVCCFGVTLLEVSKKIKDCADEAMRVNLTHTWAVMLSIFMRSSLECLDWPQSPASSYAKEVFIKMFSAAGQYAAYLQRMQDIGMEEYEIIQDSIVKASGKQHDIVVQASLLVCVTKYWLTSGLKAESNASHIVTSVWSHMMQNFRDEDIALNELYTGALWSAARKGSVKKTIGGGYVSFATRFGMQTRSVFDSVSTSVTAAIENRLLESTAFSTAASEGSTLVTDYVYSGSSALVSLVSLNPNLAEKSIAVLNKVVETLLRLDSTDYIAIEALQNNIAALEAYTAENHPKPVATRNLSNIIGAVSHSEQYGKYGPLSWLEDITNISVYATSRLQDPLRAMATISTEEAVLRGTSASSRKLLPFSKDTLVESFDDELDREEGDSQILHGSSDPFGVVASHRMDTIKGLAVIRVEVTNRSGFNAENVNLDYSASGAVLPLPDAPTYLPLGSMDQGKSVVQSVTLSVQRNHGFAAKVHFSITMKEHQGSGGREVEQSAVPYFIPSANVLLLRRPSPNAGIDVFRRRWDAMPYASSLYVFVRKDQTVDLMVDMLERKSGCLQQVGRMRTHSHVSAMVADSSTGDYVAVVALAPEGRDSPGAGPCVVYMTVRSISSGYSHTFRNECHGWLKDRFRVVILDDDVSEEDKKLALRPQDAYFISDGGSELSPYQRWRKAHALRMNL